MVTERAWIPVVAVLASGLVHVLGWLSVGEQVPAAARRMPPASIVDFSVPPAPPPVLAEPPPAPSPPKPAPPRPAPPKSTAAPKSAPETPPPAATLGGVTLTGQGSDATWASPIGNGETMTAPLPAVGSGPPSTVEAPPSPSAPAPREPILVPVRNLPAKPRPPTLDDLLQRNYPADARRRGKGGSAVVAARIEPDGVVRAVRVLTANDGDGFGDACRRTLLGSRWSAPLDASGRAVFTEIRYTCRFQVIP